MFKKKKFKNHKELLKYWDENPKEWEKVCNKIGKEIDKRRLKDERFFKSRRYKKIHEQVVEWIKEHRSISDDNYKKYMVGNVTNNEFCDYVSVSIDHGEKIENEKDEYFSEDAAILNGVEFLMLYGQGTAYIAREIGFEKRSQ